MGSKLVAIYLSQVNLWIELKIQFKIPERSPDLTENEVIDLNTSIYNNDNPSSQKIREICTRFIFVSQL